LPGNTIKTLDILRNLSPAAFLKVRPKTYQTFHLGPMKTLIKHLLSFRFLYIIIGGFLIYLLGAAVDLIFIPTLEMSDGWCKNWTEKKVIYRQVRECTDFRSEIDALKLKHNKRMEKRQSYKMIAIFFSASLVTYFLMWLNPANFFDKSTAFEHNAAMMTTAVYYGVFLGFLMQILFQELLPPPHEWFPDEFLMIRQARVEQILKGINEMTKFIPQETMAPE